MSSLCLKLLDQSFSIHRLHPQAEIPPAVLDSLIFAITSTDEELSIVALESVKIQSDRSDSGWACFKVEGPLEFGLVGVLAGISCALAGAKVPLFALSTFDTDYVLVKREQVEAAKEALTSAGYRLEL